MRPSSPPADTPLALLDRLFRRLRVNVSGVEHKGRRIEVHLEEPERLTVVVELKTPTATYFRETEHCGYFYVADHPVSRETLSSVQRVMAALALFEVRFLPMLESASAAPQTGARVAEDRFNVTKSTLGSLDSLIPHVVEASQNPEAKQFVIVIRDPSEVDDTVSFREFFDRLPDALKFFGGSALRVTSAAGRPLCLFFDALKQVLLSGARQASRSRPFPGHLLGVWSASLLRGRIQGLCSKLRGPGVQTL